MVRVLSFYKTIFKNIVAAAGIILVFCPVEIFCSQSSEIGPDIEPDMRIEHFKKEAEDIDRKIENRKAKVLAFAKKENTIISTLNETDFALNKARKRISVLHSELAAIEEKIKKTSKASIALTKRTKTSEDNATKRLIALYKLSLLGRVHVLASAESISDFFQRKRAMERILAYDESILANLVKNKAGLQRLLEMQNAQRSEQLSLESSIEEQISILSHERAKRSRLLSSIRKKKSFETTAIESLKQTANALNQKIKSLSLEFNQVKQVKKISPKSFASFKGLLKMPVKGKIISFFGPYKNTKFNIKNFRSGIDIKADRGEPIRAVCDGRVLYSSWFKGYGNMIIIDHGDNYYTVYAHAEEIFKAKGDSVERGEVVATVGDTGSMIGPGLYFEVRHHGKPINPLEWLSG